MSISSIFAEKFLALIQLPTTHSFWSSEGEYDTTNPMFPSKTAECFLFGHAKFLKSDLTILKMAYRKSEPPKILLAWNKNNKGSALKQRGFEDIAT